MLGSSFWICEGVTSHILREEMKLHTVVTFLSELLLSVVTLQTVSAWLQADNITLLLFSCPVMSNLLQPHGLLHARPLCPSPSPRVCPSSCSLHWWCCPTISYSDTLISFCPWPFPAPGTLPMSHLFASNDQNIGASASASVLPSEYSGLISLKINWFDLLVVQGTFRGLLQLHSSKALILWLSAFFTVQLSQPYVTTGKTIVLTIWTFVRWVTSLLFNTLSRFVIAFLPRSSCLLIS